MKSWIFCLGVFLFFATEKQTWSNNKLEQEVEEVTALLTESQLAVKNGVIDEIENELGTIIRFRKSKGNDSSVKYDEEDLNLKLQYLRNMVRGEPGYFNVEGYSSLKELLKNRKNERGERVVQELEARYKDIFSRQKIKPTDPSPKENNLTETIKLRIKYAHLKGSIDNQLRKIHEFENLQKSGSTNLSSAAKKARPPGSKIQQATGAGLNPLQKEQLKDLNTEIGRLDIVLDQKGQESYNAPKAGGAYRENLIKVRDYIKGNASIDDRLIQAIKDFSSHEQTAEGLFALAKAVEKPGGPESNESIRAKEEVIKAAKLRKQVAELLGILKIPITLVTPEQNAKPQGSTLQQLAQTGGNGLPITHQRPVRNKAAIQNVQRGQISQPPPARTAEKVKQPGQSSQIQVQSRRSSSSSNGGNESTAAALQPSLQTTSDKRLNNEMNGRKLSARAFDEPPQVPRRSSKVIEAANRQPLQEVNVQAGQGDLPPPVPPKRSSLRTLNSNGAAVGPHPLSQIPAVVAQAVLMPQDDHAHMKAEIIRALARLIEQGDHSDEKAFEFTYFQTMIDAIKDEQYCIKNGPSCKAASEILNNLSFSKLHGIGDEYARALIAHHLDPNNDDLAENLLVLSMVDGIPATETAIQNTLSHHQECDPHHMSLSGSKDYSSLGFPNLGNTCYLNSTLKLLLADPKIRDLTQKPLKRRSGEDDATFNARELFRNRLDKVFEIAQSTSNKSKEIGEALNNLLNMHGNQYLPNLAQFTVGHQNDADEYRTKVLELLDYDKNVPGFRHADLLTHEKETKYDANSYRMEKDELYGTKLEIQPMNHNKVSQAINHLFEAETIEGVDFSNSKTRVTVEKKPFLAVKNEAPSHIFVDIKRHQLGDKDSSHLDVDPISINFVKESSLADGKKMETVNAQYEPIGIVVHDGVAGENGGQGHYIEYSYNSKTGKWVKHNDMEVTVLTDEQWVQELEIIEKSATTVLYQKKQ